MSENQNDKYAHLMEQGIAFYEKRDFHQAIESLLLVTDKQASNWLAKLYLGLAYYRRGDQLMARPLLRFIVTNCPETDIKARAQAALTQAAELTPSSANGLRGAQPTTVLASPRAQYSSPSNSGPPDSKPVPSHSMTRSLVDTSSGQRHFLADHKITIGSDSRNQVVIAQDPFISRLQATITRQDNEFWLEDSAAINPTRLNGKPINGKTKLCAGDAIKFGKTVFRLE